MKKVALSIFSLIVASIVYAEQQPSSNSQEMNGAVIISKASVPRLKRVPGNVDILLVIEDTCTTVRCLSNHGVGQYQIYGDTENMSISGEIDCNYENQVSIPYVLSDSSVLDFYIEFEDGSWCHLTWGA